MPVASGATATEVNLNDTVPAAPAGSKNVQWQGGVPYTDPNNGKLVADVSAHVDNFYDVIWSLPGLPDAGVEYLIIKFARTVTFPPNFAGVVNPAGESLFVPTLDATFTLKKSGVACGTVVFHADGTVTFTTTGGLAVTFTANVDYLTVVTPSPQDATLADAGFTLPGVHA